MKRNERKQHIVYTALLLTYFIQGITAYYIVSNHKMKPDVDINFLAVVYHIAMLFIILYPFRQYTREKFSSLQKSNEVAITVLTTLSVIFSFASIITSIPRINVQTLLYDTTELRSLLFSNRSGYLAYLGELYWTIPLVLMFYYMINSPQKRLLIVLMFVCSLTKVLSSFVVGGREYVLKYIVEFALLYYFLHPTISLQWRKVTNRVFVGIFVFFAFVFFAITMARFSNNYYSRLSSEDSVLLYFGQGMVHFSRDFTLFPHGVPWGGHKFPILFGYGSDSPLTFNNTGLLLNNFSTCIGSFIKEKGILFATIITIVYSWLFSVIGKIKVNVFTFIYLTWAIEFIISSPFFFNDVINGTRFISLLGIIFLDIFTRKK